MRFKRVFHYYWPQVKKYKWSGLFIFAAYGIAVVLSHVGTPILYKEIIDLLSNTVPSPDLARNLYGVFFKICLLMLVFNVCYRLGDYLTSYFQANVLREIYNDTFEKLLKHSYKFFSNSFSGSLVAKTKRFTASFERISDIVTFSLWFVIVDLTGVFVVLFWKVPQIAILFSAWVIIYIVVTFLFIRKKITYDLSEAEADSKVTARLADSITNTLNIKIFSGKLFEIKIFKDATLNEYVRRLKSWNFGNLQNGVQGSLMVLLELFVMYSMIKLWLINEISSGTIVLVQLYMTNIFRELWELGKSLVRLFKSLADAKEMTDILDQPLDIVDVENPEKCAISVGEVEFRDVNFGYIDGIHVFEKFNLKIKPGEKVGLVGHSGSGKSTITKILLRFADVAQGEVLIDGQNIAKIKQDDLRSKISYVPQEPILFHRSIQENIRYSHPDAKDDAIISAAKRAHAHEFISTLQHSYNTLVGERGVKLSGGERQRIAIARAMLKFAPILVLDEATSSLDSISESYIQEAFSELMKGKTTLVIAHRLSTVQKMDRIIVLEKGKIVEEGTHKELLEKRGFYADLWDHQTGGFLE